MSLPPPAYWERRLKENWGLQGVGYLGFGTSYNKWLYAVRKHIFKREVSFLNINPCIAKVLDVGSGTGFWLEQWQKLGARKIVGSDITNFAVQELRKAYPTIRILRLDIANSAEIQKLEDRFDVITAFDVLFHIPDDERFEAAIENVSHLLSVGGYFLFSDNFVHGIAKRNDYQVSRSIGEIEGILNRCHLRVMRRVPVFVVMNCPVDTVSAWPLTLWRLCMVPVRLFPALGQMYGAILFPLELALTRILRESPSTEMMICQKVFA